MAEGGELVKVEEPVERIRTSAPVGAIVKVEKWRDKSGRMRTARPHPLAGRTGEGAPIAPPGWLWKAGYRNSDMYFYSPLGQSFRSQLQLQSYLATIPNPPPMSAFRWRFGPDEFKNEPLPGVPPENPPPRLGKSQPRAEGMDAPPPNKKRKLAIMRKPVQIKLKEMPKRIKKAVDRLVYDVPKPSSLQQANGISAKSQKAEHGQAARKPEHVQAAPTPEQVQGASEKKSDRRGKKEVPVLSFAQLLSAPTSYNVLSKNPDTLQKFLVEAERLKEKGESEIGDLRNVLFERKHTAYQLSKYPESVLRVFYFLLRNEDPPSNFGMRELIQFCSSWNCKHKHYWCLLETSRVENCEPLSLTSPGGSTQTKWMKSLTVKDNGTQVNGRYVACDVSHDKMGETHQFQSDMVTPNNAVLLQSQSFDIGQGKDTEHSATVGQRQSVNGFPNTYAQPLCGDGVAIHQATDSEGAVITSLGSKGCVPETSCTATNFVTPSSAGESINLDDDSSKQSIAKSLEHIFATPYPGGGSSDTKLDHHGQIVVYGGHMPQSKLQPGKCGCHTCSRDPSFCYGCTCSLCKVFIQPKQSWTFFKCPICSHFCHLECALKARRAGVVKEMELDGEFLCPCCLNRSELLPFWMDQVKDALRSIDRTMVQNYLTSAVLVLNGTQRQEFQTVHQSVMELHDSLLYNTPCPHLEQILHQIHETLDNFNLPLNHKECSIETASLPGFDKQEAEVFQEEEKVRERQKQAELDYMEWLLAEKNADMQRLILQNAQEELKKAESNISTIAHRARASRTFAQLAESRLQSVKKNCRFKALTKEQLEKQKEALDMEIAELSKLQNRIRSLELEPHGNPDPQLSHLHEEFKTQQNRVETAKARLEQINHLNSFLA